MKNCSENGPVPQSAGLPASARRQASGLCYIFIRCGAAPGMAICSENAPVVLERGLLTKRSPGGRETALSIKVDADTGVFIGRGGGHGMNICSEPALAGRRPGQVMSITG